MTHKIEFQAGDQGMTLVFHGTLDEIALRQLGAFCKRFRDRNVPVRVLLDAGTKVEAGLVERLLEIDGITIEAKSPFLARWLGKGDPEGEV